MNAQAREILTAIYNNGGVPGNPIQGLGTIMTSINIPKDEAQEILNELAETDYINLYRADFTDITGNLIPFGVELTSKAMDELEA